MNNLLFITSSALYVTSLAAIDGIFNRLIFRNNRALPYEHIIKRKIYSLPEWQYIGIILLIILPLLLPLFVSYSHGGLSHALTYLIVLLLIQWDMIFGKIVFNDWFGDKPSIALPYLGWVSFSLKLVIITRLMLATLTGLVLSYIN